MEHPMSGEPNPPPVQEPPLDEDDPRGKKKRADDQSDTEPVDAPEDDVVEQSPGSDRKPALSNHPSLTAVAYLHNIFVG
jgi:hypothetical protein